MTIIRFAILLSLALFFLPEISFSQDRISTEEYIDIYAEVAIAKMKEYGIPASITLAQGILESGSGNSRLATQANNHFGIKCHKDWTGKTFYMDDDEKNECFRKYKDPSESYNDHSLFLTQRDRYAFLFDLEVTDYQGWAHGLKKAGYATNPRYPELLIKLIERHGLDQFDKGGITRKTAKKDEHPEPKTTPMVTPGPNLSGLPAVATSSLGRQVYENNGVRFIRTLEDDTFAGIANEFDIYSWQLYKYNELEKNHEIIQGEIIYLEKKKRKAAKNFTTHIVQPGETVQKIAALYGVRSESLLRRNNYFGGARLKPGTEVKLR